MTINKTRPDVQGKIPIWILPASYIVIIILIGMSIYVLHIIPYNEIQVNDETEGMIESSNLLDYVIGFIKGMFLR